MKEKQEIKNTFFEFILLFFSIVASFYRGIVLFLFNKKIKNNLFFDILDFIFISWPKYFWLSPSLYKIFSFPWDLSRFISKK